jgi:hypothetical protein
MWMYLGPSCPDCPLSNEFGDTVINTRICGVLAYGGHSESWRRPHPLKGRHSQPLGECTQTHF